MPEALGTALLALAVPDSPFTPVSGRSRTHGSAPWYDEERRWRLAGGDEEEELDEDEEDEEDEDDEDEDVDEEDEEFDEEEDLDEDDEDEEAGGDED